MNTVCRIINPNGLAFLHVPKTGGASIIQTLDHFFDHRSIAPAYNPPDFEVAPVSSLYRGHMYGEQQARLFPGVDHFTIVREPVALMRSMHRWLGSGGRADLWRQDSADIERVAGDDEYLMISSLAAAKASAGLTFSEMLSSPHQDVRERMVAIQVRSLGDGHMFDPADRGRAVGAALATVERCQVVGDTEDLEMAIWLLCDHRKWPAPAALDHIHPSVPTPDEDGREAARLASLHGEDEVYGSAKAKVDKLSKALLRKTAFRQRVAQHLNRQADALFFANAPTADSIVYPAGNVWPGTSWGTRLKGVTTHKHYLGASGRAVLFAKVLAGQKCTVKVMIGTAKTDLALLSLCLSVNGRQLPITTTKWSPAGCELVWTIDRETTGNGHLRLTFETEGRPEDLVFNQVEILAERETTPAQPTQRRGWGRFF